MNTEAFDDGIADLYQNAPFGYLTMRVDGLIIHANDTLLHWLGYKREAFVFVKSLRHILGIGDRIYMDTHLMPLLQMNGFVDEINVSLVDADGVKFPGLLSANCAETTETNERTYRVAVMRFSQRKRYELELREARLQAEKQAARLAQINQELEQFAHTASHDLQAPLNTILGLMSLLEKRGHIQPDGQGAKYYELIRSNAQRMKLMIKDLLEYSKLDGESSPFEPVSLSEACAAAVEMLEAEVSKHKARISIEDMPAIEGDKIQLARLFMNLIGNAIKYRSDADPVVSIRAKETPGMVTVYVNDNGMGFDSRHTELIFGFMKRLHSHDHIAGTGIGLSACQRIVELHGGTIGAESEPGRGSTFFFTLPKLNA